MATPRSPYKADGARPRPPTRPAARSEIRSPYKFSDKITSQWPVAERYVATTLVGTKNDEHLGAVGHATSDCSQFESWAKCLSNPPVLVGFNRSWLHDHGSQQRIAKVLGVLDLRVAISNLPATAQEQGVRKPQNIGLVSNLRNRILLVNLSKQCH